MGEKQVAKIDSVVPLGLNSWTSSRVTVILAVAGGYCVYVMHLAGKTMHEHYLGLFGIDSNLFPRSLDDIATLGQVGLLERLVTFFMAIVRALEKQGLGVLLFMVAILFLLLTLIRRFPKVPISLHKKKKIPPWLEDIAKSVLLSGAVLGVFVEIFALSLAMLMLPVTMGQSAGRELFDNDMRVFAEGCKDATVIRRCVQLLKANRVYGQGYVIDSSLLHIAIYDVRLKQARAFERNGLELRVLNLAKL